MKKANIFIFLLSLLFPFYTSANPLDYPNLNVSQAFSFNNSDHQSLGYIVDLKIENTTLAKDIHVTNPITKTQMSVATIISSYNWTSVVQAPMKFSLYVSANNRKKLMELTRANSKSLLVDFNFQIFSFDEDMSSFYLALRSFNFPKIGIMNRIGYTLPSMKATSFPIQGLINKEEGKFQMTFDESANSKIDTTANYGVQTIFTPAPGLKQQVVQGVNANSALRLPWGL